MGKRNNLGILPYTSNRQRTITRRELKQIFEKNITSLILTIIFMKKTLWALRLF